MIRRKFMKFAPKEHNDEKVKKNLEKHNVPTFEGHQPSKFGQFSSVAKDLAAANRKNFSTPEGGHVASAEKTFSWQQKAIYGGGGSSAPQGGGDPRNPYAVVQPKSNPYAQASPAGGNPYGGASSASSAGGSQRRPQNAYGGGTQNAYGGGTQNAYGGSDPYGAQSRGAYEPSLNAASPPSTDPRAYGGDAYSTDTLSSDAYSSEQKDSFPQSYPSRPHKAEFDQPDTFGVPLTRTQTSQTTASTAAARKELFGSAGQRKLSSFGEDDELNQLPDELNTSRQPSAPGLDDEFDDIDELNVSQQDYRGGGSAGYDGVKPGYAPSYARGAAYDANHDANYDARADQTEEEDELNRLPTDPLHEAPVAGAPSTYHNYGEARVVDFDDEEPGYVTGDQLFSMQDSEDEDVEYVKREIRQTKQETVESSRRALQIASEAETSGRNALGMLGDQGERLGNSARTVQLGGVQARVGEENADELIRLNRSIFIPNVSNPFNSRRRNQMKAARLQGQQVYDQLEREELERVQRESEQRVANGLNGTGGGYSETAMRVRQRMNRDNPERKMYQFEADSDDDALEDELDQNLDGIQDAAKRLHQLSLNINSEVNSQNQRIEEMGGRVDDLDHRLHKSTAKMATIN